MSTQMLEMSRLGAGTALRLERDAWSMVKRLRQATNNTLGASDVCLVGVKPDVLRPGIAGMRGSMVIRQRTAMHDNEHPPAPNWFSEKVPQ